MTLADRFGRLVWDDDRRAGPGSLMVAAAVFFGLSSIGSVWSGDIKPSPLWPATAAITALALALPVRLQWWVVAGGGVGGLFASPILFDDTMPAMLGPIAANTVEMAIATVALRAVVGHDRSFRRLRHGVRWIGASVLAAGVGAAIAMIDTASTVTEPTVDSFVRWWVGGVTGLVLVASITPALRSPWTLFTTGDRGWMLETITAPLVAAGLIVLTVTLDAPTAYLIVAWVSWCGLRFGPRLAVPLALAISIAMTWVSELGHGPFADFGSEAVLQVQSLNLVAGSAALLSGAHAVRAWTAEQRLRAALGMSPDHLMIVDGAGTNLGSWGAPDIGEALQVPEPVWEEDPLETVGHRDVEAQIVEIDGERWFERRSVPVAPGVTMRMHRDVTDIQQALIDRARALAALEGAREAERRRVAHDLHDGVIQPLAAAGLFLSASSERSVEGSPVSRASTAIDEAVARLRGSIHELAPDDVAGGGLVDAVRRLASEILVPAGVATEVRASGAAVVPSGSAAEAVYVITREAFTNVVLHAGAARTSWTLGGDETGLRVEIVDDGVGIAPRASRPALGHIGIVSMRRRAIEIGGMLTLEPRTDGSGTVVRLELPSPPR